MKFGLLLIMMAFGSEQKENKGENAKFEERFSENNANDLILVKIEEDEYTKMQKQTSKYIGVSHHNKELAWRAQRWSKNEKKVVYNGSYKDEETAAHASDTLARKLMANREQNLKLNFPDDDTEVYPKKSTSKYTGVSYNIKLIAKWRAHRWIKNENKNVYNGYYKDEDTAAHASDTLARKLMANGEQNLKLNFPDDHTEVYPEEKNTSKYIGVSYNEKNSKWRTQRWSKEENKPIYNGSYKNEETAAHASDTLARKFMTNCEQNLKLNFPDDRTEVKPNNQRNKRKRSEQEDLGHSENN